MPIMCSVCKKVSPRVEFIANCQNGTCKGAVEEKDGVVIKADTVGGLEALAFELFKLKIPVRQATVGPVNKKDILILNMVVLHTNRLKNTNFCRYCSRNLRT